MSLGITGSIWGNMERMPAGSPDKIGNIWRGTQFGISFSLTPIGEHAAYGETWIW